MSNPQNGFMSIVVILVTLAIAGLVTGAVTVSSRNTDTDHDQPYDETAVGVVQQIEKRISDIKAQRQLNVATVDTAMDVSANESGTATAEQGDTEVKGTIQRSGDTFTLIQERSEAQQTLASPAIDLNPFIGKLVTIKGKLTGTALTVHTVEMNETATATGDSSATVNNDLNVNVDQAGSVKVRANIENSVKGTSITTTSIRVSDTSEVVDADDGEEDEEENDEDEDW